MNSLKIISKKFWRFLGSVYMALFLIGATACYVAIGTFLEAETGSHRYAAHYTFSSSFFSALLTGFFVNIAAAAMQRWPWRRAHTPFLLAHLGLLLLLSGTFVKIYFGTQGSIAIAEGSGTEEYFLADSYAVKVEKRIPGKRGWETTAGYFAFDPKKWQNTPLPLICQQPGFENIQLTVTNWHPHGAEKLASWIQEGNLLTLRGMPPLPLLDNSEAIVEKSPPFLPLQGFHSSLWQVYAVHGGNSSDLLKKIFVHCAEMEIRDVVNGALIDRFPLQSLLEGKNAFEEDLFSAELSVEKAADTEIPQYIHITLYRENPLVEKEKSASWQLSLNTPQQSTLSTSLPYSFTLHCLPTLLVVIDKDSEKVTFLGFNSEGLLHSIEISPEHPASFYAYSDGFQGYSTRVSFPFPILPHGQEDRQQAHWYHLYSHLKRNLHEHDTLITPLQLCKEACKKTGSDFAATLITFLSAWQKDGRALCPLSSVPKEIVSSLQAIEWTSLGIKPQNSVDSALLFSAALSAFEMTPEVLFQEEAPSWREELQRWHAARLFKSALLEALPMTSELTAQESAAWIAALPHEEPIRQTIEAAYIVWQNQDLSLPKDALQGISLYLLPTSEKLSLQEQLALTAALTIPEEELALEATVVPEYTPLPALEKWEDNLPLLTCQISDTPGTVYTTTLLYQRHGIGLAQPILDGSYRISFQPLFQKLPYRLRLRHAHQINYPRSNQPFSYECELWITPKNSTRSQLAALSMNHIWETWDGYRFYLANIAPGTPGSLQRIQLAVNRDPAKYWLTYPGALILSLGILLLLKRMKK